MCKNSVIYIENQQPPYSLQTGEIAMSAATVQLELLVFGALYNFYSGGHSQFGYMGYGVISCLVIINIRPEANIIKGATI